MELLILDLSGSVGPRLHASFEARGHRVDTISDPSIALWRSEIGNVDAVVICCDRPALDDLATIAEIGSGAERTPVVMLAASADDTDVVRVLDAGADDIMCSPVSAREFDARLRAIARRATPQLGPSIEVGTLRLEPHERRAWRDTHELDLSPREFALLEVFMRHPGRLLTREFLLDGVWDVAYLGRSNVVDQGVSHVRRKIDRPFGRDDLQTVRGAGYRLRAG